jgi:hypothetical protein
MAGATAFVLKILLLVVGPEPSVFPSVVKKSKNENMQS